MTLTLGLIREGKVPTDNRVALIPAQCKWISKRLGIRIVVQSSANRCYADREYSLAGVAVREDMGDCDLLLGIKEVPVDQLVAGKTYLFFSHTKKKQPHNQKLLQAIIEKQITLVDYECMEHEDGQRIIGFGFFAGVVGAHNGMMAYGKRTGQYDLAKVHLHKTFRKLIHTYFGLRLPAIKIVVTGSGRVAGGILEIMNLMGIIEVEPDEFLQREFTYPVFVHLKGANLYAHNVSGVYNREAFHSSPVDYVCTFRPYLQQADILMNGVYWDQGIPRLFDWEDLAHRAFRIQTIADITDDVHGSVPCNIGDATIDDPVYGVDRLSGIRTAPYRSGSVDMMAVGNLPNELPRDASRFFGEQLIKYILDDLVKEGSPIISRATIVEKGKLTPLFGYLEDYANG